MPMGTEEGACSAEVAISQNQGTSHADSVAGTEDGLCPLASLAPKRYLCS